jgi:rfaE bifunctional protein nucleotidyltransferase chain/domain
MGTILAFDRLAEEAARHREAGRRVVLCHGVFDLLHIGHIRYLRGAKEYGDVLAVTLTPDKYVDKGPGRPAFTESLRAEMLASLGFVDYVAVNPWPTAENTLKALRPDVYAKGAEFQNLVDDPTGKIALEAKAAEETGARLVFIDDITFSSSNLINRYMNTYSEELAMYLNLLRQRYRLPEVLDLIDSLSRLKVLVLGEAIIDQYAYCSPLGLSSKDPTMAVRQTACDSFAGGAAAVARHAAGLAGRVDFLTVFGRDCPYLELVRESLPPNVRLMYEEAPESATVRKLRYVDSYSMAKLLEIYHLSDQPLPEGVINNLTSRLADLAGDYDLVLAADYGHGLIARPLIETLCGRAAPYLAVNTQANAGNRGYHTIWRWPRADFISLAHHEISLAFQDRQSSVRELMAELKQKLRPATLVVTCGSEGLTALSDDEYIQTPALATRVIDRVGAGDALFAVAALSCRLGFPLEITGLLGNIAGAIMVETAGTNRSITRDALKKAFTAMLK